MNWDQTSFAARVKRKLESLGWTQIILAGKLKKPTGTVSGWLTSEDNKPSLQVILDLADKLKVRPSWLAFEDEFEPMDDEEQEMIVAWRKLNEAERIGFLETIKAVAAERTQIKKPGTRTKKQHLEIQIDHDAVPGTRLTALETKARESEAAYGTMSKKPKRVNRRNELSIYSIASAPDERTAAVPCFHSIAAGFGGADLERSPDLVYIRELPDWRGVHSMIVRGDSMEDTLHPDDLILVRTLNEGEGMPLEALDHGELKTPVKQVQRHVPDDEIFILSIGNEPPTVKRVKYAMNSPTDWHLLIVADNPDYDPQIRVLPRNVAVKFYGQVMGIGEGKYAKR